VKETVKSQVFSKSTRTDLVSKEEKIKPGPGQYDQVKEFGKDSYAASIRGRP
jgi:hypothetical protein